MLSVAHAPAADGRSRVVQLAGALDIATAAQAQVQLLQALAALPAAPVHLDTESVIAADSAGVQLLLSAARELAQQGRAATTGLPPEPLRRVARALGACDDAQCCGFAIANPEPAA